jgi:hypothetical protein
MLLPLKLIPLMLLPLLRKSLKVKSYMLERVVIQNKFLLEKAISPVNSEHNSSRATSLKLFERDGSVVLLSKVSS